MRPSQPRSPCLFVCKVCVSAEGLAIQTTPASADLLPVPSCYQLNWGVDYTAGTSVSMRVPPPYDYNCPDIIR
jgi:hypothetical protein